MDVKNNPAGRLHDVLNAARHQDGRQSARDAWAGAFEVTPADTRTLFKMLADLMDLVEETKASIGRLSGVNNELHLRPFKKIDSLLSHANFDAPWESYKKQIDEATLVALQFSADALSRVSGSSQIADAELSEIRRSIDELFSTVADSSLPEALKLLLLRNLESIRHAFLAYRLGGIDGIKAELERTIGSLFLHQEEVRRVNPESDNGRVVTSFFTLVERLNQLVELARTGKELAAPAMLLLTKLWP